jgi:hypothetical protein
MNKFETQMSLLNTVLKMIGINKKGRNKIFEYIAELTGDKKMLINKNKRRK